MIEDFFDALNRLTLLRSPYILKKVSRVDSGAYQLGRQASHIDRANAFARKWALMDPNQVQANRYFERPVSRRS
jgi:hypothetical protein